MTHDEMIEVIKAHKEGKKLQFRPRPSGKLDIQWTDLEDREEPTWNFQHIVYRVTPQPMTVYARVDDSGMLSSVQYSRAGVEQNCIMYGGRVVKFQEVQE